MSSDDAVKRVLAGEKVDMKTKASTSRSQDKENREGHERQQEREVSVFSLLEKFVSCGCWHVSIYSYKWQELIK